MLYDGHMTTSLLALGVLIAVVAAGAYLFRVFTGRHTSSFDGGVVSQSWLMEHRAGTKEDRFS